jgi:hypothetical protein
VKTWAWPRVEAHPCSHMVKQHTPTSGELMQHALANHDLVHVDQIMKASCVRNESGMVGACFIFICAPGCPHNMLTPRKYKWVPRNARNLNHMMWPIMFYNAPPGHNARCIDSSRRLLASSLAQGSGTTACAQETHPMYLHQD